MRKTSQGGVASKSTQQRRPMEARVSPDRTPSPSPPATSSDIVAGGGGGGPRSPLDSPPPLPRPQPRTSSSSQPAAAVSPATSSLSSQSPAVEGQGRRRESNSGASSSRQLRGTSPPAFSPDTQTINALNRATSPSTGGNSGTPASYVVLGYSGAGQIFDLMKEQLLRNRSSCWSDGSPLLPAVLHGQLPAITGVAKQQQHSGKEPVTSRAAVPSSVPSSIGGTAPCCDRWSGISLYLGDKSSAERCLEESRYLAIRNRRKSSAAAIRRTGSASALGAGAAGQLCGHQKAMNDLRRRMMIGNHVGENDGKGAVALNSFTTTSTPPSSSNSQRSGGGLPAPLKQQTSGGQYGTTPQQGQQGPAIPYVPLPSSPVTLVNYIEGLKAITLKNRMVKTLRHYFRYSGWSELGQYLPITYQMIPDPKGPNGGSTTHDERVPLVQTMCQCNAEEFESSGEIATYWIAKSSHGAHGSNIRIFFADQKGLDQLVRFIDGQRDAFPWVVSRYIDRPLLYNNRKFDIRCWVLVTPNFDIYLHDALVMRMSSETYDRKNITTDSAAGRLANITNHCVQAEGRGYSQFESGNELWRDSLDELVRTHYETGMSKREKRHSRACQKLQGAAPQHATTGDDSGDDARTTTPTLENCITPQIVRIVTDSIVAALPHVPKPPEAEWRHTAEALERIYNPSKPSSSSSASHTHFPTHQRQTVAFQMLGYDFIIDRSLVVWLLEVNGSPGVAQKKIHDLVRDAIEIAIDPMFPPPSAPTSTCSPPSTTRHRVVAGTTSPPRDSASLPNGFRRVALGTSVLAAAAACTAGV